MREQEKDQRKERTEEAKLSSERVEPIKKQIEEFIAQLKEKKFSLVDAGRKMDDLSQIIRKTDITRDDKKYLQSQLRESRELIENAVKYMGDQPQPRIEIGAQERADGLVFYVRDNGIGIAPEHHQRIFNVFAQLDRNSEGTGLGLALIKKIVTSYQGRLWVESAGEGQGSCFCFTLPQAVSSQALLNSGPGEGAA